MTDGKGETVMLSSSGNVTGYLIHRKTHVWLSNPCSCQPFVKILVSVTFDSITLHSGMLQSKTKNYAYIALIKFVCF